MYTQSISYKDWIFASKVNGRLCFYTKILCKIVALAMFLHSISLWSQDSVSASGFIQSICGNQCFLSRWQLCSLCRIISLLQAVVIGWVFKLFWRKKSLPALRERWKWTPHCAETWTPWHSLHCMVRLPHCIPPFHTHTLTQNLTASAFPDLDHMSYIHFLAAVTSVQAKAISKYLETWLYSIKSSY